MTFVEIHLVQTVPPSCLNRDDTGSPKTATYGGTERARVSSQAWKRATRRYFAEKLGTEQIGTRTVELPRLVAEAAMAADSSLDRAAATGLAAEVCAAAGLPSEVPKAKKGEEPGDPVLKALAFVSGAQVLSLAQHVTRAAADAAYLGDKDTKKAIKADADANHSLDIALFGRMVADPKAKDLNVDAACQVAHALGVSRHQTEFDFYVGMDDAKVGREDTDAGSAMMGTIEFSSATLYRYAVVDMADLVQHLGAQDQAVDAALLLVEAFTRSLPTGRQNSFAAHSLPAGILVTVREDQPVSLVGAYEKALSGEGLEQQAIAAMRTKLEAVERMYGLAPQHAFWATEDSGSLPQVLTDLRAALEG